MKKMEMMIERWIHFALKQIFKQIKCHTQTNVRKKIMKKM